MPLKLLTGIFPITLKLSLLRIASAPILTLAALWHRAPWLIVGDAIRVVHGSANDLQMVGMATGLSLLNSPSQIAVVPLLRTSALLVL